MEGWKKYLKNAYGFDALSCALLFLCVVLNFISLLIHQSGVSSILGLISYLPVLLCLLRCFSKNYLARRKENELFVRLIRPLFSNVSSGASRQEKQEKKLFKFFKCPNCKQKVRVPKGKGKIEILCPNCATKFIKKS